jgi:hypothetical protein
VEKCTRDIPNARNDYLEALIASYGASESKVTRIQILSIIVDLMPYNDIKKLLPEVTDNKLYQAKKQLLRRYDFLSHKLERAHVIGILLIRYPM